MATVEEQILDPRVREAALTIPVYGQLPFVPERASGCDIFTRDGRRILDLYGGHAVAALGYGHPRLVAAIHEQSSKLLFQSNAVALDVRAEAAEQLTRIAPEGLDRVFFVNSGAEANENALRMALMATGRKKVLALTRGFHGRTAAAAAVTWNSDRWYGFTTKPFEVDFIPRDDVDAARKMIDQSIAAVIFEPVQGVAGAYDLSNEFIETLRSETAKHGAILIADEVQSGMGRCGRFFGVQAHRINPDIITSAKALGGGILPVSMFLARREVMNVFTPGDHGSTFGGNPLGAAVGLEALNILVDENLAANSAAMGDYLLGQLRAIDCPLIKEVRGKGLFVGVEVNPACASARDVCKALMKRGLLSKETHSTVVRLAPPLIISKAEIDWAVTQIREVLDEMNQHRLAS